MASDQALAFEGEHTFRVGQLLTPVRVRAYRRPADGAVLLEPSHFLKTAIQYLPHAARGPFQGTAAEAVAALAAQAAAFHEQAVRRGYPPSEDWLVPNTSF
jgi:hypothetical protein